MDTQSHIGILACKHTDEPKINPTSTGARVEFELYNVSLDWLRGLMEKELLITIGKHFKNNK